MNKVIMKCKMISCDVKESYHISSFDVGLIEVIANTLFDIRGPIPWNMDRLRTNQNCDRGFGPPSRVITSNITFVSEYGRS